MGEQKMANFQPFEDYQHFSSGGIEHTIFSKGSGPGVLLLHELPGMTPEFWRLANWLAKDFTVWTPDLYGNSKIHTAPGLILNTSRVCISREIYLLRKNSSAPITTWLRAAAHSLKAQSTGKGVGVIGMCMTGNFALTLALDEIVTAPVASQPSLPTSLPLRKVDKYVQMSPEERETLKKRDVDVMALRFKGDKFCTAPRFDAIRELVCADRFFPHQIDDEHQNPNSSSTLNFPHSCLTADLVDDDDAVTKQKLGEVIAFLKARIC